MSKFSLDVLQRQVFPCTQADDPDIILGAAFGEDVALTRVGGDILVSHVDPIVGAIGGIGWPAVHVACNDVAAAGIAPRWLLLLVLVPQQIDNLQGRQVGGRNCSCRPEPEQSTVVIEIASVSRSTNARLCEARIGGNNEDTNSRPFGWFSCC